MAYGKLKTTQQALKVSVFKLFSWMLYKRRRGWFVEWEILVGALIISGRRTVPFPQVQIFSQPSSATRSHRSLIKHIKFCLSFSLCIQIHSSYRQGLSFQPVCLLPFFFFPPSCFVVLVLLLLLLLFLCEGGVSLFIAILICCFHHTMPTINCDLSTRQTRVLLRWDWWRK